MDFLGMTFADPLLTLLGIMAGIVVGWAILLLMYRKEILTRAYVIGVAFVLSLLGMPFGYMLWGNMYTVIGPTLLLGSIVMLCSSLVMFFVLGRGGRAAPRRAPAAPMPAGPRVEGPVAPIEKIDEDVVRLKVEKTATESALKSLEAAVKEGAITKETFEKHKATYSERLRKIESELSKRTKVGITKLEGEIERIRSSYLDRLKDLSKKAITIKPAVAPAPKAVAVPPAPPKPAVARAPEPTMKLPEIPTARMEERIEQVVPRVTTPPAPVERLPPAPARAAPSGPTTISDLRREMMDELNRLKRLIGRAEA